jgi:hypothetical protein
LVVFALVVFALVGAALDSVDLDEVFLVVVVVFLDAVVFVPVALAVVFAIFILRGSVFKLILKVFF